MANLKVLGEIPRKHGSSAHVMKMNQIALDIAPAFMDLDFMKRQREKVTALESEDKKEEATVIREQLLNRSQGGLENIFFMGLFCREHNFEEKRFALETRRLIDLKNQIPV